MGKFHLYHISFFKPIFNGLESQGVSLKLIDPNGLIHKFNLEHPNIYLPREVGYQFLIQVKKYLELDCLVEYFYRDFKVLDLHEYGTYILNSSNLKSALKKAIKHNYLLQTHCKLDLLIFENEAELKIQQIDSKNSGSLISEKINLVIMLKLFEFFLGSNWSPIEIKTTTSNGLWLQKLVPSTKIKYHGNSSFMGIRFKTQELITPNSHNCTRVLKIEHRDVTSMEGITDCLLKSIKGNEIPTLEEFAKFFGSSKRTIIRKFNNENVTYKMLVEEHRYLIAMSMLTSTKLPIENISYKLGYAHPSNFIRAFKRWTSLTPYNYRQQNFSIHQLNTN